jgi:hypothetical protein
MFLRNVFVYRRAYRQQNPKEHHNDRRRENLKSHVSSIILFYLVFYVRHLYEDQ